MGLVGSETRKFDVVRTAPETSHGASAVRAICFRGGQFDRSVRARRSAIVLTFH